MQRHCSSLCEFLVGRCSPCATALRTGTRFPLMAPMCAGTLEVRRSTRLASRVLFGSDIRAEIQTPCLALNALFRWGSISLWNLLSNFVLLSFPNTVFDSSWRRVAAQQRASSPHTHLELVSRTWNSFPLCFHMLFPLGFASAAAVTAFDSAASALNAVFPSPPPYHATPPCSCLTTGSGSVMIRCGSVSTGPFPRSLGETTSSRYVVQNSH